jgi:hemerythrin
MPIENWSADYEIGIHAIDVDHKTLFDTIALLGQHISDNAGSERIKATIHALLLYVDEHFEREERFLCGVGYPEFNAHKMEHDRFRESVFSLRDFQIEHPELIDAKKVISFLEDWLIHHILQVDKDYAPYLLGEKKGNPDLQKEFRGQQNDLKIQITCPTDKKSHVEHFIKLISESSEEGALIEAAVEKITALQKKRRSNDAKKLFGH